MYVNKTKFEGNSSQQYYHMTCIGGKKTYKQKSSIGIQLPDADSNLHKLPFPLISLSIFWTSRWRHGSHVDGQVVKNKSFLFEKWLYCLDHQHGRLVMWSNQELPRRIKKSLFHRIKIPA